MKKVRVEKKNSDGDEDEEEIAAHLGGYEPLVGHFTLDSRGTSLDDEDDFSNDA